MLQFLALAATLFGGGYLAKKALDKHKAPAQAPLTSKPYDEFLEIRSDGLHQFNRHTAISILGWLGSVSLRPVAGQDGVYDLVANADGSPPESGSGAAKRLIELGKKGNVVMLSRDVTVVGRPERRAATVTDLSSERAKALGGEGGSYAILIVPAEEHVEPSLPPVPGFEGEKGKGVPGQKPLGPESAPSEMPNDIRRQIDELLKKTDADAKTLANVSTQLRQAGHHVYADLVEARAADLRALEIASFPSRFFVIPDGHPGAVALAKKMTGDGKRYADLLAQNPVLSALADGTVVPWSPGQVVRLPSSWST